MDREGVVVRIRFGLEPGTTSNEITENKMKRKVKDEEKKILIEEYNRSLYFYKKRRVSKKKQGTPAYSPCGARLHENLFEYPPILVFSPINRPRVHEHQPVPRRVHHEDDLLISLICNKGNTLNKIHSGNNDR
jgi:hypothetical protein